LAIFATLLAPPAITSKCESAEAEKRLASPVAPPARGVSNKPAGVKAGHASPCDACGYARKADLSPHAAENL